MTRTPTSALKWLPATRPPVVLLGGLNVVRALGLGGIAVIVASPERDEPALFSRYCRAHWPLPPLHDTEGVLARLESLSARLRGRFAAPVPLFCSNDEYLRLVHENRERLAARYRLLMVDADILPALMDKDRFASFAASRGLPVPRLLEWESRGAQALANYRGKVLVKPAAKAGWGDPALTSALFGDGKALIRDSGQAARADPLIARAARHLVFQEYIEGGDDELWCFDGVADEEGRLLASHVGRKRRCAPPLTGDSCYIELAHDKELQELGRAIAFAVPLKGIFNMDLKRDPSTGRFYLLEINARCNLWLYIGARNGMNLAKVFYDYLMTGARPKSRAYKSRYRWIDFKLDRAAYRALAREGKLSFGGWVRSLMRPKVYSLFAWRDPEPLLHAVFARARRRFSAATHSCAAAARRSRAAWPWRSRAVASPRR